MSVPVSLRIAAVFVCALLFVNLFATVRVSLVVVSFEVPLVAVVAAVAVGVLWARRVWCAATRAEWVRREQLRAETNRLLARPMRASGRLARSTFGD